MALGGVGAARGGVSNWVDKQGHLDPLRIADSTEGVAGVGAGVELLIKGLAIKDNAKAAKEL